MNKTNIGKKIHVSAADIPDEGLNLSFENLERVLIDMEGCRSLGPVSGQLSFRKVGNKIHLHGRVVARVGLCCDRCLEEYTQDISTSFFYLLCPRPDFNREIPKEMALESEDMEVYWYEDGEIHCEDIFREQILLELPFRNLCSEVCKGLCPGCGVNLNKQGCVCKQDVPDGPFAVLRNLRISGS